MARFSTAWIAAFFLFFLSPSTQLDTMMPSNPLDDGQTLVSAGGRFELGFFSPIDSKKRYLGIWHGDVPIQTVVWVANRESPILDSTASLVLDVSGRLVVAAGRNSTAVWSSSTAMKIDSPVAQLLDSGNLVVRGAAEEGGAGFAWQSFDYPTHTLLPGMKLGYDLVTGVNRSLSAWKNNADPSSTAYSVVLEPIETQIVLRGPSGQLWRSGPWNGLGFSGMPITMDFNFTILNKDEEVYFMYHPNVSIISNLVLQPSGSINLRVWVPQTDTWALFWSEPQNQCDALAPCGPNGVCNVDSSPVCSCLKGFAPREPANWALLDGTDGCVRRAALNCSSDGFNKISNMKLPDTAGLRRDLIVTFAECRAICVFNCSCYAYASAEIDSSGGGQGCMIWSSGLIGLQALSNGGQDLYLRLDKAESYQIQSSTRGTKPIAIIIAPVTSGTLVLSLVGCIIWRKKRKTKDSMHNNYNDEITQEEDLDLPMLDLKTIMMATDNFSIKNKLGEGGFGPVYKGILGDGQDIAVKRLSKSSIQGAREFKNEVILIARLQHRNLVRLLGCCIQGEEKILVYEYMPNKSLDSFLFVVTWHLST